jgi:hypothetical protein
MPCEAKQAVGLLVAPTRLSRGARHAVTPDQTSGPGKSALTFNPT